MTGSNTVDKDTLICALIRKLGGVVSLTTNDLTFGPAQVAANQLSTGTLHLELINLPPTPEQHFLAAAPHQQPATSNYPQSKPEDNQDEHGLAMPADE